MGGGVDDGNGLISGGRGNQPRPGHQQGAGNSVHARRGKYSSNAFDVADGGAATRLQEIKIQHCYLVAVKKADISKEATLFPSLVENQVTHAPRNLECGFESWSAVLVRNDQDVDLTVKENVFGLVDGFVSCYDKAAVRGSVGDTSEIPFTNDLISGHIHL